MRYAIFLILLALSATTQAAPPDTWVCQDHMGKTYQSPKNVEWDTCSLASQEAAQASNEGNIATRKIKPFCSTQKTAKCEVVGTSTESGFADGAGYRLYEDRAEVASEPGGNIHDLINTKVWDISCLRDKMSGQRSCEVSRGDLWVVFRETSDLVAVGSKHFPGSTSSIKIGSRRFDTAHHDGVFPASKQIIDLLKDGQPVVTRHMKWPDRSWVDDEFTVSGFQASAKLARWLLKNGTIK